MAYLHTSGGAIFLLQALTSAFFAILFLQSGSDKIIDRLLKEVPRNQAEAA